MQTIEYVDINKLKLHEHNPRLIKDEAFKTLCQSIKDNPDYFETRPILVNKDFVIFAGNMRYRAAKEIGLETVPVSVMDIPEDRQKEIMIRDNIANGEWDFDSLANNFEVSDLIDWGFDENLLIVEKEVQEDDFDAEGEAAKIVKPESKSGDIYQLGKHRLMCGSSTSDDDVKALMGGIQGDMMFTDPPFNLKWTGRGSGSNKQGAFKKKWKEFEHDNETPEEFAKFLDDFSLMAKNNLKEGASLYVCIDWRQYPLLKQTMDKYFYIDECIIWDKTFIHLGGKYRNQHEFILYALNEDLLEHNGYAMDHEFLLFGANGKKIGKWYGGKSESNIWYLKTDPSFSYNHPTQKPIDLPGRGIKNSSKPGDVVLELFGGSGSTLLACEQLDRVCYCMELDPTYVDVIIRRWEKHTGQKAVKL